MALGAHGVGAQFREQCSGPVHEVEHLARGQQPHLRFQRAAAHPGAQQGGQRARHGVGQAGPDLVAHPGRDGQFEVPARVLAAGSAPQGQPVGGEPLVGVS